MIYKCIYADPPWSISLAGKRKRAKGGFENGLPYPTLSLEEICNLDVSSISDVGSHIWLWTTNQTLKEGFQVLEAWGFKYLMPIHWIKPSGVGNWFIHRTQTILFGYKDKCIFSKERYKPNIVFTKDPVRHSQKPEEVYDLIESISSPPYIELFARNTRENWDYWGNEVSSVSLFNESDIKIA